MNPQKPKSPGGVFRWVDTPWSIAAVLGAWGVMIGNEAFLLADIAICFAAILAAVQLARETLIWTARRHTPPFVFGLLTVLIVVGVAFWWTGLQKSSAETKRDELSKLGQIPQLKQTIQEMRNGEQEAAKAQAVQEASLQQQVKDIGADNKSLKTSIEKKDAVLAQIARDQYALNFTPEITTETDDSPDQVKFVNLGKTNVMMSDVNCTQPDFNISKMNEAPGQLAPNSWVGVLLHDENAKANIVIVAPKYTDGRVPLYCTVSLETLDKRHYLLPFTWTFVVKDKAISRSYAIPRAMIDVKN